MSWWKTLDESVLGDDERKILAARQSHKRKREVRIVIGLVTILVASYFLMKKGLIDTDNFELIWTAMIGGFMGASMNSLLNSKN